MANELEELEQEQLKDASENSEPVKEKKKNGLTQKQWLAITLILEGATYTEIAKKCDIHPNTLKKWRASKAFSKELNKQKREVMKTAQGVLLAAAVEAANQLIALMDEDSPDKGKVALLWKIYEEAKTKTIEDDDERIAKLEEFMENQQQV